MSDLADENYANYCREQFLNTIKCKYVSLNVGTELPICEGDEYVFRAQNFSTQTQKCFETARAVWVPRHLYFQR